MLFADPVESYEPYTVLARRKRPQDFAALVGQESVAQALERLLEQKTIPHAFLFAGTRGTGKTSTARILAMALCCEKAEGPHPCHTCPHCVGIAQTSHEDVMEIDGASHTGVDHIRTLREVARLYPKAARYRVFIIDEVHMLSSGAFNALLKTLEEPPPRVVFILATTELQKIPATVRSRCLTFSFKKVDVATLAAYLGKVLLDEGRRAEPEALTLVAREAQGSVRDGLSLLEPLLALTPPEGLLTLSLAQSALGAEIHDQALQLFEALCVKDTSRVLDQLAQAEQLGLDLASLIEKTAEAFREALVLSASADPSRTLVGVLPNERVVYEKAAKALGSGVLSECFRLLASAVRDIAQSTVPLAWAEVVAMDCLSRAEWLSARELWALWHQKAETLSTSPATPVSSQSLDVKSLTPTLADSGKSPLKPAAASLIEKLERYGSGGSGIASVSEEEGQILARPAVKNIQAMAKDLKIFKDSSSV